MPNLSITPGSPYARHSYMGGSAITVSGVGSPGATVRVVIVSSSDDPIYDTTFTDRFNAATTKNNTVVPSATPGPGPGPVSGPGPGMQGGTVGLSDWAVEVPVSGPGSEYVIYADNGGGKLDSLHHVTIN